PNSLRLAALDLTQFSGKLKGIDAGDKKRKRFHLFNWKAGRQTKIWMGNLQALEEEEEHQQEVSRNRYRMSAGFRTQQRTRVENQLEKTFRKFPSLSNAIGQLAIQKKETPLDTSSSTLELESSISPPSNKRSALVVQNGASLPLGGSRKKKTVYISPEIFDVDEETEDISPQNTRRDQ
ncbi:unnamed protein product, partial [Amoebophrya sp. A25]